jgi:hypothetical protein
MVIHGTRVLKACEKWKKYKQRGENIAKEKTIDPLINTEQEYANTTFRTGQFSYFLKLDSSRCKLFS